MKNAGVRSDAGGETPPRDILQRTFQFAARIVQLCVVLDERPGVGRVMMSQVLRAGTTVTANVEEAQAAQSKADFISKMSTDCRCRGIKRVLGAIIVSSVVATHSWLSFCI